MRYGPQSGHKNFPSVVESADNKARCAPEDEFMIGFPAAVVFANAFEWWAHKHLLHGRGRDRNSSFSSHWRHHKRVRQDGYRDSWQYERPLHNPDGRWELRSIVLAASVASLPGPLAPFWTLGVWYSAARYWHVHRRSHLDPEWGRTRVPWHYDHHMNTNQSANWCVTRPWFDHVMGTRIPGDSRYTETNVLGMRLPGFLERPLNRATAWLTPGIFATLNAARLPEDPGANRPGGSERAPTDR